MTNYPKYLIFNKFSQFTGNSLESGVDRALVEVILTI